MNREWRCGGDFQACVLAARSCPSCGCGLAGPGCPAAWGLASFFPRMMRGDGAPSGATFFSFAAPAFSRNAGASRRSTRTSLRSPGLFCGDSCPRGRASGRGTGPKGPDPAGFRPPSSAPRPAIQGRVPRSGDGRRQCEVTSLARGRHPFSRFSSVLQERPSADYGIMTESASLLGTYGELLRDAIQAQDDLADGHHDKQIDEGGRASESQSPLTRLAFAIAPARHPLPQGRGKERSPRRAKQN
jgi:hypothetical protein